MSLVEGRHQQMIDGIQSIAARVAESMGVELVEVCVRGSSKRRLVRIDIDRPGTPGVGIADCQAVSQALGDALDESDVLREHYVLEVSSPGIDRPIRTPDDVRRNTGRAVVVTTTEPIAGCDRFRGVLVGGDAAALRIRPIDGPVEIEIPLDRIRTAQQDAEI